MVGPDLQRTHMCSQLQKLYVCLYFKLELIQHRNIHKLICRMSSLTVLMIIFMYSVFEIVSSSTLSGISTLAFLHSPQLGWQPALHFLQQMCPHSRSLMHYFTGSRQQLQLRELPIALRVASNSPMLFLSNAIFYYIFCPSYFCLRYWSCSVSFSISVLAFLSISCFTRLISVFFLSNTPMTSLLVFTSF